MRDTELYRKLLGIEHPWKVADVQLNVTDKQIHIRVEYDPSLGRLVCPECGAACRNYDHREERAWRHLDTCEFRTWLIASVPRIECPDHGVQTVAAPWSTPYSRFTLAFKSFAICVLEATQTQSQAARLLGVDAESLHEIMVRAVERGLSRRDPEEEHPHLTIDETSRAGRDYVTIVGDTERALAVAQDHTEAAAQAALQASVSEAQKAGVQTLTMDMWRPYEAARESVLPDAKTVYDRFHVVSGLNDAVDQTRRAEHHRLEKVAKSALTGTKYLFLHAGDDLSDQQRTQLDALAQQGLETPKVWALKEGFREFFECSTVATGKAFFQEWYPKAMALENRPLAKVAEQIRTHLEGVLAYLKYRVTNASAEGLNSRIQALKANARGFPNTASFRTAILFHLGRLDLLPQPSR